MIELSVNYKKNFISNMSSESAQNIHYYKSIIKQLEHVMDIHLTTGAIN